ncbi:MAG: hypothetical protein MZW92_76240 [Comamonadaceae bacterium]|nr:hypothetical protein [Comamonadaceae bacterium]
MTARSTARSRRVAVDLPLPQPVGLSRPATPSAARRRHAACACRFGRRELHRRRSALADGSDARSQQAERRSPRAAATCRRCRAGDAGCAATVRASARRALLPAARARRSSALAVAAAARCASSPRAQLRGAAALAAAVPLPSCSARRRGAGGRTCRRGRRAEPSRRSRRAALRRAGRGRRAGLGARPACCTASPAAARPRSTCAPIERGAAARRARRWCWCPRSTSRRSCEARVARALPGPRRWSALHSGLTPAQRAARLARWRTLGARRHRARHAAGGVRAAAAAGADRRRRGARPLVQAAGRRALFGARPGGLARAPGRRCRCVLGSATPSLETWQHAPATAATGC